VFGLNKQRTLSLTHEMIDAKLGIQWDCLTRVNLMSDEILISMKKAGCVKIDVGVESGSQRILEDTQKGITIYEIVEGVKLIKKHSIFVYVFLMIGLPSEIESDIAKTKEFLVKLKPNWAGISIFTPIPGTKLFNDLHSQGYLGDNIDFAMFSHQSPYNNFAVNMVNREEFPKLAAGMIAFVQNYNGSLKNLIRRALTRKYHRNPGLFLYDLKKVLSWKGYI
jgi:radical SAM superfamily enzyme YgiQ (UPF0313 family)